MAGVLPKIDEAEDYTDDAEELEDGNR